MSGFKVADKVEGYKDGSWHRATIEKISRDGTYTLEWDDGDTRDKVPASQIRERGIQIEFGGARSSGNDGADLSRPELVKSERCAGKVSQFGVMTLTL